MTADAGTDPRPIRFGRALRARWHLDPDGVFLNHGSYGACPIEVLDAQAAIRGEMERQPDIFFRETVHPENPGSRLRAAADRLGRFVGTRGERLAFVSSATEATNTVLRAVDPKKGDEVLVLDCVYGAVQRSLEALASASGVLTRKVPLGMPVEAGSILARVAAAVGPRTRLAIIDHIASPSAALLPVKEIVACLHDRGVPVLVDGAHAPGQIPLAVEDIGADWYTGNAHKWLYAPKGSAFLYASEEVCGRTKPLVVSHYYRLGFPRAFDYTGTSDKSAWLAVPAAIDFFEALGPDAARGYLHSLADSGNAAVGHLGATPIVPPTMNAAMRAFVLPQRRAAEPADAAALMHELWVRHRVQVMAVAFEGMLLLRFSAQVYVEAADYARAIEAIDREGWAGRS